MLKDEIGKYYFDGNYNCAETIIRAGNDYYNLGNTLLYISSGLGTSNINFRMFNQPSINLYRFYKE